MAGAAGSGAVGALGALAYLQSRLSVAPPDDHRILHVVDGHVGVSDDDAVLRVVWLGDSLAAGLGAISPEVSLPRLVAVGREGKTRLHVFATPGATSHDVVGYQLAALEQLRHGLAQIGQRIDAIGVTVGGNDIAALTSRRRFRSNVGEILQAAGDAPVVLVSIPELNDALRLPRPLRTFASWRAGWLDVVLRQAARADTEVHYASVRRRPDWISRRDLRNFLAADRFHPSGAGYAIWADRVADAFETALTPPDADQLGAASPRR